MNTAYLSLGSNIEPATNMVRAVEMLAQATTLIAVSTVWESPPIGLLDQANFLNAAAIITTPLSAKALKTDILRQIERDLGRVWQADKNAPRPMDIDLMLFNQDIFQLDNRQIPDDEILSRPFVAIPLAELAPNYRHPQTEQTLQEIAARFTPITEGLQRHHGASQAVQAYGMQSASIPQKG